MIVKNYGISFGQSFPAIVWVSCLLWGLIVYGAVTNKKMSLWLVVVGGGLNLAERILRGYVTDYWRIPFTPLYNNINDWLIFIGCGWYIWEKLIKK
ncbi:MAG: signal peptidase II [Microgenomates group bacterium]